VGLIKNLIVNTIDEETTVERRRALKENIGDSEEELDNQADREMLDEAEITAMRK
jgi:Arc/MetJ family transcription regulator